MVAVLRPSAIEGAPPFTVVIDAFTARIGTKT